MTLYTFRTQTKRGWEVYISENKKLAEEERDFALRHGYTVTPVYKHNREFVRIASRY